MALNCGQLFASLRASDLLLKEKKRGRDPYGNGFCTGLVRTQAT